MTSDQHSAQSMASQLDQRLMAMVGRSTGALSVNQAVMSYIDWFNHLAVAPGHQFELLQTALSNHLMLAQYLQACASRLPEVVVGEASPKAAGIENRPVTDWRFGADAWHNWPYNVMHQSYLLSEQWWRKATTDVPGVNKHHADVVSFAAGELLKLFSPRHYLFTNPELVQHTIDQAGANLGRGAMNAIDDFIRNLSGKPVAGTQEFKVGEKVAVTPGKVIVRNQLMELIQYEPLTGAVHPEPVLVIPAWIMKYYILDLSPENSLIRYLLEQGFTVFCISWKNPGYAERNMGMDDYLDLGFNEAMKAINTLVPAQKVHALGYCLGGTLLSIAASAMARDHDDRLASMSMLAAQTEFSEPGELSLFIDESQVTLLESVMADAGFLTSEQMAGAFQLLRSDYLIWSYMIDTYLKGERPALTDLMAWNADATRMPARMHSQYLRRLFLDNDLAEGRYPVKGKPVSLNDVTVPIFCLGTVTDHVAPWRSVYKIHLLTSSDITFVLTSGGHNAGVVTPPGHPKRCYQMLTRKVAENYLGPDDWLTTAPQFNGSWWPAWVQWLKQHSSGPVAPPSLGDSQKGYPVIDAAPGQYVLEK